MSVFIDTSGLLATLDADDLNHPQAKQIWQELVASEQELVSTNYVLVELLALVQRRLGMDAVNDLVENALPILRIEWVDESRHAQAVKSTLDGNRRQISLVDWSSFNTMRALQIDSVFTFDKHFAEQGFTSVRPSS
jgi:predicted nucleic acid-binding protein